MESYKITPRGRMYAQNIYAPRTAGYKVLWLLNHRDELSKEQIYQQVPDASWHTLRKLRKLGAIQLVASTTEAGYGNTGQSNW